jgi:hypothetical protein
MEEIKAKIEAYKEMIIKMQAMVDYYEFELKRTYGVQLE